MTGQAPALDPIRRLVLAFSRLPGIGEKTATRLTFFVLNAPEDVARELSVALGDIRERVRSCSVCCNLTECDPCRFCADPRRDDRLVCVVESVQSLLAIERTGEFRGRYHVLHGVLSPLDGIGPEALHLKELVVRCMHLGAEHLIFDQELSPSQLRNIATETDLKVLDRTQLILDIFSQRATTREGKLQVELAQLRYRRPRLAIMPTAMSRLTGGIGGRGPGETKLEINRRRADERETRIEKQLEEISDQRAMRRERRKRVGLPLVAIVGYTNAGKSTLLNRMTNAAVDAEDKLFATLDPTSRRLRFPEEREIVLTDTVGFIRKLPKDLVHAFRSTLDESVEADLLLVVVNVSDDEAELHKATVEATLAELGAANVPRLIVLNQADRTHPARLRTLALAWGGLAVSGLTGEGMEALLERIEIQVFRGGLPRHVHPET